MPVTLFIRLPIKNVGCVASAAAARNRSISLGKMLAVGIEKDHPRNLSTPQIAAQPVPSCLDRFAFAAVLIVNNDFCAGFARALCGLIARAIINDKDVIESLVGFDEQCPRYVSRPDTQE